MTTFGARFHAALADRGPFCVGIDPHAALLHEWGLDDDVAGLERFALTVVEAVAPLCSVVKPQSAFYERFGSRGVAVLERVIAESRAAGALVLLDVKRGDIGSTSQAYADAYLDPASPLAADAVTVSPYLGFGSLDPFVETAPQARRRPVRARADLQQGGPGGAARPHRLRRDRRRQPMLDHLRGSTPTPSRSARSAPSSAPPSVTRPMAPTSTSTARSSRPASAPRAAPPPTSAGSSGRPRRTSPSARRARCCAPDPTMAAMRDAVRATQRRAGRMTVTRVLVTLAVLTVIGRVVASSCRHRRRRSGLPRRRGPLRAPTAPWSRTQQQPLTEALRPGRDRRPAAALPSFEALLDARPRRHRRRLGRRRPAAHRARDALDAAGVDPATYDPVKPPDASPRRSSAAIEAAATRRQPEAQEALENVQQQARDVCGLR